MTKTCEALLVLGCGIDQDGALTDDARSSVRIAADLHKKGLTKLLIFSGSYSYKTNFVPGVGESQRMKDYACTLGVPTCDCFVEAESKDTLGNFYFTKVNVLEPLHIYTISILRGPNHSLERITYLCKKVLGPMYVYEFVDRSEQRPDQQEREATSLAIVQEWFSKVADGDDAAIYQILLTKHPAYNASSAATN